MRWRCSANLRQTIRQQCCAVRAATKQSNGTPTTQPPGARLTRVCNRTIKMDQMKQHVWRRWLVTREIFQKNLWSRKPYQHCSNQMDNRNKYLVSFCPSGVSLKSDDHAKGMDDSEAKWHNRCRWKEAS